MSFKKSEWVLYFLLCVTIYHTKPTNAGLETKDKVIDRCFICLVDLWQSEWDVDDEIMQTFCGKLVHVDCAKTWYMTRAKSVCPHCRQDEICRGCPELLMASNAPATFAYCRHNRPFHYDCLPPEARNLKGDCACVIKPMLVPYTCTINGRTTVPQDVRVLPWLSVETLRRQIEEKLTNPQKLYVLKPNAWLRLHDDHRTVVPLSEQSKVYEKLVRHRANPMDVVLTFTADVFDRCYRCKKPVDGPNTVEFKDCSSSHKFHRECLPKWIDFDGSCYCWREFRIRLQIEVDDVVEDISDRHVASRHLFSTVQELRQDLIDSHNSTISIYGKKFNRDVLFVDGKGKKHILKPDRQPVFEARKQSGYFLLKANKFYLRDIKRVNVIIMNENGKKLFVCQSHQTEDGNEVYYHVNHRLDDIGYRCFDWYFTQLEYRRPVFRSVEIGGYPDYVPPLDYCVRESDTDCIKELIFKTMSPESLMEQARSASTIGRHSDAMRRSIGSVESSSSSGASGVARTQRPPTSSVIDRPTSSRQLPPQQLASQNLRAQTPNPGRYHSRATDLIPTNGSSSSHPSRYPSQHSSDQTYYNRDNPKKHELADPSQIQRSKTTQPSKLPATQQMPRRRGSGSRKNPQQFSQRAPKDEDALIDGLQDMSIKPGPKRPPRK